MNETGNRYKRRRGRVDIQVLILTALIVVISCYLVFFMNYYFFYKSMIEDLQYRASNIHEFLEDRLENDSFYELEKRQDTETETYREAKELLENIRKAAGVRYLYTAKENEQGELVYLVDGLPSDSEDFRYIGDSIEPECIPDLERALMGNQVLPEKINKTTWGCIFISYFPMHEGNEIIGVVGIEFDAQRQYNVYRNMAILTSVVILFFCSIAAVVAVKMFRRISNPSYQDLASTDFLTGLKNRNAFEVDLNNLNNHREKMWIALISIDLDKLKTVNDTYGHAAGDAYIKTSADIILSCIGETDILYRIGGDEFSVIIKEKDKAYLEEISGRVYTQLKKVSCLAEYDMDLSMGYAVYNAQEDADLFETLKKADSQMYMHKKLKKEQDEYRKGGRNR